MNTRLTFTPDLCNALEDLSQAEKEAELLPIIVQHLYVLTKLGRAAEADQLASSIQPTRYRQRL